MDKILFKVGHGYDVHKLEEGYKLILGGIVIPYEKGLKGHSDADVLTHAVIDSLIGAAGLGDIGMHFPETDSKYKDIDSMILLDIIKNLIKNDYTISNIDCIIVTEEPKISPYREQIRNNLAYKLGIDYDQVNIKAKTEEGLGFTGAKLGIAAHATCLLIKNQ